MDGNSIWDSLVSGWGLLLAGVGFVVIIGRHFLGSSSSVGKTVGFCALWAVILAILFNIESLRTLGDSIWSNLTGA